MPFRKLVPSRVRLLPIRLMGLLAACCALGSAACLALPVHHAQARAFTVQGAPAPGPARFDKVFVNRFGPRDAGRVLVLVPGTGGGAGDFTNDARALVARVPNLQVWAVDRREQALEDTGRFQQALRGEISPDAAFDYYLGWLINPTIQPHYTPMADADVGFTREWGLAVQVSDLRRVILRAKRGDRQVILGGHALGAATALAYSTWDFRGYPGYRDLAGVVLIDGGLLGTFDAYNLEQAQAAIAQLQTSSPFLDLLAYGLPWTAGAFGESLGMYARLAPAAPSAVQSFPLLPGVFNPGFAVTNRALLGYAFDEETSPASLSLIHLNAGQLASSGNPRDWEPGEISPIENVAALFGQEPFNGVEWYFPRRLTIDRNGADQLAKNAVGDFLGLRTWHTRQVDVPLYALQTSYTGGHVLRGAERFIRRSAVTPQEAVLVNREESMSHFDPLTAGPETNALLKTVPRFLVGAFRAKEKR